MSAKFQLAGVWAVSAMYVSSGSMAASPTYLPMFSEPMLKTSSDGSLAVSWSGIFWSIALTGSWT